MTQTGIIFWDMAGTLLVRDEVTGGVQPLPGCDTALRRLGRRYRHCLTTGDLTGSARALLRDAGLLRHFAAVFGDLVETFGKPYGELARRLGCPPERCLAVGDSLLSDIPSDTDRVVTLLVNQESVLPADSVVAVIERLAGAADGGAAGAATAGRAVPPDHVAGFQRLLDAAERLPGSDGTRWRVTDPLEMRLGWYTAGGGAPRPLVVVPG